MVVSNGGLPEIQILTGCGSDCCTSRSGSRPRYWEREQSWRKLLLQWKRSGLVIAMSFSVGDGSLWIRAALREMLAERRERRRCIQ